MAQKQTMGERLAGLKTRSGLSIREIAKGAGYSAGSGAQKFFEPSYDVSHLSPSVATRLSAAFVGKGDPPIREEEIWQLVGSRDPVKAPLAEMPVRYRVAASLWVEVDDFAQEPLGYAPFVRSKAFANEDQWAEQVEGDSCDLLYPDGAWIHVVSAWALDIGQANGKRVVVQRTRAGGLLRERTVKEIVVKPGGRVELVPRSTNKKWKPFTLLHGVPVSEEDVTVEIHGLVIGHYRKD